MGLLANIKAITIGKRLYILSRRRMSPKVPIRKPIRNDTVF